MAYIVKEISGTASGLDLPRAYPVELADPDVNCIAPAGCPIMSACLIVEKMAVAVCDGRDRWFLKGTTKFVTAGESWAGLF